MLVRDPAEGRASASSERRCSPWFLFVALAIGAWLRFDQLLAQVPADDEWHALRAVLKHDFAWIFTHFGSTDHCIPLTLYDELVANTIGLGEFGLRLPTLVCGLASIVVLPLLVRPLVGERAAHGLALLIATSPVLVYFSRYARPYSPAVLAACVALLAAWRWREEGGRSWAVLYAACAVLATWFMPVYGPLVLAPWCLCLAEAVLRRRTAPHATSSVLLLGLALGLGLALLLAPPLLVDLESLTLKMSNQGNVGRMTLLQLADLYTGTGVPAWRSAVLVAALLGCVGLARRAPQFVAYLLLVFAAHALALAVANPAQLHAAITLTRYTLPLQPFMLLALAVLLADLDQALRLPRALPVTAVLGCALLFSWGPLPGVLARPNAFTNHAWHQYYYGEAERRGIAKGWGRHRKGLPPFYRDLAQHPPGTLRILEVPWLYSWTRVKQREAQALHRQHVLVGFLGRGLNPGHELPLGAEFQFRSFVEVADHDQVVRREIDYVVFHNDLTRELKRSMSLEHIDLGTHLEEYRARFGPPVFEDKRLTVFAVR